VTIKVSTKGSGGKTLKKKVTVLTDDPENEQIPLTITGRILAVYTLTPKSVKLTGVVGETLQETIRLVPSRDYPFTVTEVTAKRGDKIRFRIEEKKDANPLEYELTVENTATEPGVYFDTLALKTDSEITPEISISVVGKIKEAATEAAEKPDGANAADVL